MPSVYRLPSFARVLPHACFIGFTGTPIFAGELPTVRLCSAIIRAAAVAVRDISKRARTLA